MFQSFPLALCAMSRPVWSASAALKNKERNRVAGSLHLPRFLSIKTLCFFFWFCAWEMNRSLVYSLTTA